MTEHEARIKQLEEILEAVTEFALSDNAGRPIVARRHAVPYIIWEFTRPDGTRARVTTEDPEQAFDFALSIALYGVWPDRMMRAPEFEELESGS